MEDLYCPFCDQAVVLRAAIGPVEGEDPFPHAICWECSTIWLDRADVTDKFARLYIDYFDWRSLPHDWSLIKEGGPVQR